MMEPGFRFPAYFKFSSTPEIKKVILETPAENWPSPQEVLTAYVALVCAYGVDGSRLSSTREPFVPPTEYCSEINALMRSGYMKRSGDEVLWTDKIAPAMEEAYLWGADGHTSEEVEEAVIVEECSASLDMIPEFTKHQLKQQVKIMSELDFVILLRDDFDGLFPMKNADGTFQAGISRPRLLKAIYHALRYFDPDKKLQSSVFIRH